ncbi:glycosyl transferase [Parabacteroides distasonis]|nr:glycosyl transferase [Parabacteroides distasonis]
MKKDTITFRIISRLINSSVNFVSDELFLKMKFVLNVGYWPNLKNPKSFNEKIQWLKLHHKRPEYTQMVDKVAAKEYVAKIIGKQYIIPSFGVWDSVDEIDWASLPNKFVIKASHDSGGVVVCKDKSQLDIEKAKAKLKGAGEKDYTKYNKEYVYHDVPHRFIAEELLENGKDNDIPDYKIFCFNGVPRFLFVATGRQINDTRFDFYDTEFNHLPVLNGHPNADIWPKKPKNFNEMLEVSAKLSQGIPEVRVDLYNIDGKIYFGELTFFHWSGMTPFEPREWDYKFGEMMVLPQK